MNPLKNFEQYAAWLRNVYKEDPLLMLARRYTNFDVPGDNELIVLSTSPNELERILTEIGFVPKQGTSPSERNQQWGTPWTREPLSLSHRDYVLKDGLTYVQFEAVDQPKTVTIRDDKDGSVSFMGMGEKVGEMSIHTQLIIHPYNRDSAKSIPSEQYAAMKEVYARNADKKIGERTVKELLRNTYFVASHRIFADEFMALIEYLSRQECQAAFQHYKSPQLIATHNVSLT